MFLISSDCKTLKGNSCVFPFIYDGETYNCCTVKDSYKGASWCATEVNEDGEVLEGKLGNCEEDVCDCR